MGLDMYLNSLKDKKEIEQIGYWRKANQIRSWFDNYGVSKNYHHDKGKYNNGQWDILPLSKESLLRLKSTINVVIDDQQKASELLPTSDGFFFGGTEYDEGYFEDLNNTLDIIDKALKEIDSGNIVYYSEWY